MVSIDVAGSRSSFRIGCSGYLATLLSYFGVNETWQQIKVSTHSLSCSFVRTDVNYLHGNGTLNHNYVAYSILPEC